VAAEAEAARVEMMQPEAEVRADIDK